MSHIRTHIALRALPICMTADGVGSVAHVRLDRFRSPALRYLTEMPRRPFDGIATQN